MNHFAQSLQQRHRELDLEIQRLSTRPSVDDVQLKLLKLKKLHLKDQLDQIRAEAQRTGSH
ncbi:DUF465 domain-containing protein [Alsobacter sp. SYSU BS001988]